MALSVQILAPSAVWMQLANLFFLSSALFWDLLLIRLTLVLAYTFMLLDAILGFPAWPNVASKGIGLDGIIWCVANLFFHGLALASLLWDERRIRFANEDEEQLWRFFYRRSGMGRVEFLQTLKRCEFRRVRAGGAVLSPETARREVVVVIEGLASFVVEGPADDAAPGQPPHAVTPWGVAKRAAVHSEGLLYSGTCFDKGLLNVLGVFVALEKGPEHKVTATARTACLVAAWGLEDLNFLATGAGPAVAAAWRNFALCQIGMEYHYSQRGGTPLNSRNQPEPSGVLEGATRSSDFTDALEDFEAPARASWRAVLQWLPSRVGPFVPPGTRHFGLPVTGTLASRRVMAILRATGQRGAVTSRQLLRLASTAPSGLFAALRTMRNADDALRRASCVALEGPLQRGQDAC